MHLPPSKCCAAGLVAVALAACQQSPPPSPAPGTAATSATNAGIPVISAPPATANTAALPGDHAVTPHYRIAITLPKLPADEQPLADALRATADNAKRDFLQALPEPEADAPHTERQFGLHLVFKVTARTPVFTSVREGGSQDTGGAHPAPVEATFVYDRKAGHVITLDDLFTHPDAARKALANFAHDTLLKKFMAHAPVPGDGSSPAAVREWKTNMQQMLNEGTRPTSVNYSSFVVRAGSSDDAPSPGLTLVFPPYQVAPYVFGTQTVDVPAAVFAKYLKPDYADAFAH